MTNNTLTGVLSGEAVTLAIKNGHLDCVKYLHEEEKMVKLNSGTMEIALDVEVIKYLRSVGVPWSLISCNKAAKAGRLDSLKYAHENGAPWTPDVIKVAAENGQYECMKYVIESGTILLELLRETD